MSQPPLQFTTSSLGSTLTEMMLDRNAILTMTATTPASNVSNTPQNFRYQFVFTWKDNSRLLDKGLFYSCLTGTQYLSLVDSMLSFCADSSDPGASKGSKNIIRPCGSKKHLIWWKYHTKHHYYFFLKSTLWEILSRRKLEQSLCNVLVNTAIIQQSWWYAAVIFYSVGGW